MEQTNELTLKEKLEQAKADVKELERQVKLEAAKDVVAVVTKVITDSEHVNEVLGDYTAEEGQIIGKRIVTNFDRLVEKSQDEINALRAKKAEREAKRKEREARRKARLAEKKAEKKADQKPAQTMTETVKQSEQKPVQQVAQTSAPQIQQNAQQPVQRPVQAPAQAAQQTQQKPVPGNVMYGSQSAGQTQAGNGIRYTPDGGR